MWSYNSAFQSEQVRLIPIPRYSAYGNVLGHNNKAAIISETKWTLIGRNICFVMSFSSRVQNRPRVGKKKEKENTPERSPEMFGAIPGDPWVAGLRWYVVSVAPDHWLFWCGQMWWVWPDMGQFPSGCNFKREETKHLEDQC